MKNILVLTSVYPGDDLSKENTSVVHYFAKEWVKQGYNVKVIHNLTYYPSFVHLAISLSKNIISRYYNYPFPIKKNSKDKTYTLDNVPVYRLPIKKKYSGALYTPMIQEKQKNRIINLLNNLQFKPDIVLGHWPNPQLDQIKELGSLYNARTCIVLHNNVEDIKRIYKNRINEVLQGIDVWGFRSNEIRNRFENIYGIPSKHFICHSGIPLTVTKAPERTFNNGLKNFLFVGSLIPRKNPSILINAIHKVYRDNQFNITFVGNGPEKSKITRMVKQLKLDDKILLLERLSRMEVFDLMAKADCFIMVSKPETFGLTYLEAMSMGCITIGTKNEGIDGIIKHGINGFLCEAGNEKKLIRLLNNLTELPKKELIRISKNAVETANKLTEEKAAAHYIESVLE